MLFLSSLKLAGQTVLMKLNGSFPSLKSALKTDPSWKVAHYVSYSSSPSSLPTLTVIITIIIACLAEDKSLEEDHKEEIAACRRKIKELQNEYQSEYKKAKQSNENAVGFDYFLQHKSLLSHISSWLAAQNH